MSDRARQKKIEKQKKKRLMAQRQARVSAALANGPSLSSMLRIASTLPFGPASLSPTWRSENLVRPPLVTAVITRKMPGAGDNLLTAILLIDRTCFGVKNAMVKVVSPADMRDLEERLEQMHHEPVETVPLETALSVVWHAIDYARSLGFEPHRDLAETILGPRPEALIDTPLAKPPMPVFMPGPHDNDTTIVQTLTKIHKGDTVLIHQALLSMGLIDDDADDDFFEYGAANADADAAADTAQNDFVELG